MCADDEQTGLAGDGFLHDLGGGLAEAHHRFALDLIGVFKTLRPGLQIARHAILERFFGQLRRAFHGTREHVDDGQILNVDDVQPCLLKLFAQHGRPVFRHGGEIGHVGCHHDTVCIFHDAALSVV